jgi:Bacterial tandem repeat domain 1
VVRAKGYLMISLSVYGDPGNALYAAVWLQRAGSAWVAIHGADAAAVAVVTQATLGS